jgi:hypothetical protein
LSSFLVYYTTLNPLIPPTITTNYNIKMLWRVPSDKETPEQTLSMQAAYYNTHKRETSTLVSTDPSDEQSRAAREDFSWFAGAHADSSVMIFQPPLQG